MVAEKIIVMTGASSGIGEATALTLAKHNAHIIILAKASENNQKICSNIITLGGMVTFIDTNLLDPNSIATAIAHINASHTYIDGFIHCASSIRIQNTDMLDTQLYHHMLQINSIAFLQIFTYLLPLLQKGTCPHTVVLSPPMILEHKDLKHNLFFKSTRYLTSLLIMGLSMKHPSIHINGIWPKEAIESMDKCHLINNFSKETMIKRSPYIVAEAIYIMLQNTTTSGEFYFDEDVLYEAGIKDLTSYSTQSFVSVEA